MEVAAYRTFGTPKATQAKAAGVQTRYRDARILQRVRSLR